jgi:hypothetical protein
LGKHKDKHKKKCFDRLLNESKKKPYFCSTMTKEEKAKLKKDIHKRLHDLEPQIEELKELTKPIEPDCAIGRVSRMDAINNKSISDAALIKK